MSGRSTLRINARLEKGRLLCRAGRHLVVAAVTVWPLLGCVKVLVCDRNGDRWLSLPLDAEVRLAPAW